MWALGYIIMWIVVIWFLVAGFFMTTIASQFQKELGWVGLVMMIIGIAGGWKLTTLINVSVSLT